MTKTIKSIRRVAKIDWAEHEARDRLARRIASAGSRIFGESPIADAPPSPVSSRTATITGPTEAVLELLSESMLAAGLAWCPWCEDWVPFTSCQSDVGHYHECDHCRGFVDDEPDEEDAVAVWTAIPTIARLVRAGLDAGTS